MNSISWNEGIVVDIIKSYEDYQEINVKTDFGIRKAINYTMFTGIVNVGDQITVNTTAVELSLGTGGYDFVVFNHSLKNKALDKAPGHIMKLRYTPYQFKTLSVEEQDSDYHLEVEKFKTLNKFPVVVGTLHSQVSVFFESYKHLSKKDTTAVYIMTDGAALPIQLSNNIRVLKSQKIIDYTITVGNAFGGDYEAVNIYSGIVFAYEVLKADIIMICMGPGIVGTGTKYGFSGIEQGYILDAIEKLGGTPVALPRISFSDSRDRHKGLSHHSITILKDIVNAHCIIPYSITDLEKDHFINKQFADNGLDLKHTIINTKGYNYNEIVSEFIVKPKSMGRTYTDEPYLFDACISASEFVLGGEANAKYARENCLD